MSTRFNLKLVAFQLKIRKNIVVFWGTLFLVVLILGFYFYFIKSKTEDIKAFPGAMGFGSATEGGRYGSIVFVTNLNDTKDINDSSYVGSFRWAVTHDLPVDTTNPYAQRRIILFKVSGTINLVDSIVINHPFETIAGQSAPGDGITLRGDELEIDTHDVIVRGIRIRIGDEGTPSCCRDGLGVSTYSATEDVYNVIVDHSSVSWAIDENISTWMDPSKPFKLYNITFQWNIIGEGLYQSIHIDEGASTVDPHSMGMIIGQDANNISIHHNLFVHNWGRNPRISGIVNSEIVNNVIFGWKDAALEFSEDKNVTNVIGNYFKADSSTNYRDAEILIPSSMNDNSRIYLYGNLTDDLPTNGNLYKSTVDNSSKVILSSSPVFSSSFKAQSATESYYDVLNYAGAIFPFRDTVDLRLITDVINRTGEIINSQSEVGGWPNYRGGQYPQDSDNDGLPDDWEVAHGTDPNNDLDSSSYYFRAPSGYTWIEEYINSLFPSP